MRGASVSDLHLGFRQFAKMEGGRNVREQDVERAWAAAVDAIVRDDPDLVTIAGDVFHNLRPSFYAVRAFQDGIGRIVRETAADIVIALGNHESPRTREALSPVVVVKGTPRVHVADAPMRVRLDHGGETCSVACFPFSALAKAETYAVEPDPDADVNVLLIHAAVKEAADGDRLPLFYGSGAGHLDIGQVADSFDVIAAGDFHEFRRLHPERLAFYSGAIERTSSNIWEETASKGVVFWRAHGAGYAVGDPGNTLEFEPLETRTVIDETLAELVQFNGIATGSIAGDLNELLRTIAGAPTTTEGMIMRLRVDRFPRADRDAIDFEAIRTIRERAVHFALDLRFAESDRRSVARGAVRSLESQAEAFFAAEPPDVRAHALTYLNGQGEG